MRPYVRNEWILAVLLTMLWVPCVPAQGPPGYGYTPTVADRTEPKAPPYLGNTANDLNLFFPPVSASFPRVNPNAKRATVDGRLTLLMSGDLQFGGNFVFKSFSPELLDDQTPLSLETGTPVGGKLAQALPLDDFFPVDYFKTHTELTKPLGPVSGAICDAFPETPKARRYSTSSVQNPRRCDSSDGDDPTEVPPVPLDDGYDCYDIWIVVAFDRKNNHDPQLWSRPMTVAVKNPKTSTATPVLAKYTGDPQMSPGLEESPTNPYPGNDAEAPAVTADGRLLVMDSTTGGIVYSLNDGLYDPCDARGWSVFKELSEAYTDQDLIDDKYGISVYPLRDTEGETYAAGDIIRGTYPWIDRSGSNVVWSRVGAINPTVSEGGYEFEPRSSLTCLTDDVIRERVLKRIAQAGMSFAGLWSRGKMIHIDGRANLSSYTIVQSDLERAVKRGDICLEPGESCSDVPTPAECCGTAEGCCSCGNLNAPGGPAMNTAAYDALQIRDFGLNVVDLYVDQGTDEVRIGQARNATIWSNENHFNYLPHMRPTETRDVVWSLHTDRNHMDISFDDYLSDGVLINSDMTPSISVVDPTQGLENVPYFNDGWEVDHNGDQAEGRTVGSNGYSLIPRIQNAATADAPLAGTALVPPAYGSLVNGPRIEPIALGGIKGRGVYLDGDDDWIAYELEEDGTPTSDQPAFISMWINPKMLVDEPCGGGTMGDIRRDLLHFPDGTRVFLNGYDNIIKIKNPPNNVSVSYPGNLSLDSEEWSHLAIQAAPASATTTDLTVYLNGYQIFHSAGVNGSFFRLEEGTLKVGYDDAITCKAFQGWIDDFKVIQRELNPEEVCRHAYGTLVATSDTNDEVASEYPSSAHAVIRDLVDGGTGSRIYYCEIAYPEKDAISSHLGERSDSICVRDVDRYTNPDCVGHLITFPEGQSLYHDAPRPASLSASYENQFCTSCHTSDETFYTMDPDGPDDDATSFDGGVLEYDSTVDAEYDDRRQPTQWPRTIHGAIPPGLMMPGTYPLPYDCFTTDDGLEWRLIDECFLPSAP